MLSSVLAMFHFAFGVKKRALGKAEKSVGVGVVPGGPAQFVVAGTAGT